VPHAAQHRGQLPPYECRLTQPFEVAARRCIDAGFVQPVDQEERQQASIGALELGRCGVEARLTRVCAR
jgi:hypothetical protein